MQLSQESFVRHRVRARTFVPACMLGAVAFAAALLAPPARAEARLDAAAAASEASGAAADAPVAAKPSKPAKNPDPFEKLNRATYAFNDALDRMLARPAAKAYRRVVPDPARTAVSNVLANFAYPETVVNSALQGKFKDASQDFARFVVNSTVGIGGLWDPATKLGLPRHDEDFGQTLGKWGVPSGPYVVLPLLGPSTLRDGPSKFADRYANARHYIGAGNTEFYILGMDVLDRRTELLATDAALQGAFDPYALVRNAYLQRRQYLVTDGQISDEPYEEPYEEPMDDAAPGGDAPTEAASGSGTAPAAGTTPAPPAGDSTPGTSAAPAPGGESEAR